MLTCGTECCPGEGDRVQAEAGQPGPVLRAQTRSGGPQRPRGLLVPEQLWGAGGLCWSGTRCWRGWDRPVGCIRCLLGKTDPRRALILAFP